MQRNGTLYTILFTAGVCGICSILVSGAAVGLRSRQQANQVLDRRKQVLAVAGITKAETALSAAQINQTFDQNFKPRIVNLQTGEYDDSVDLTTFNQREAAADPARSRAAPQNQSGVMRVPNQALIYHVIRDGKVDQIILPVEGRGLWSKLYGYLSLDTDTNTVRGITFYEHGETPGLGGEIENPRWQRLWSGRKVYSAEWTPEIRVIKGQAGSPETDPHRVDGLSGATLTSRGVENLINFWLGENGFGPYLRRVREKGV
jgi:Na+-transporting NADH:ubiquinone oxidoreductase subunit C